MLDKTTFTALASIAGNGFSIGAEFISVADDAAAIGAANTGAGIIFSQVMGNLFYNSDGAAAGFGSGGQFAILSGITTLTAGSFIIQV